MSITIEQCEALLPQTQCRQCSYDGCQPYAAALVSGKEKLINRCRPGGQEVVDALAALFDVASVAPLQEPLSECTIVVNVEQCIGCTLCLQACPVDAIVGEPKMQHQVLEEECTGCQLCLPVCPTSCMSIEQRTVPLPTQEVNLLQLKKKKERNIRNQALRMRSHRAAVDALSDAQRITSGIQKKETE